MIRGSLISALMLALTMALVGSGCSDDTEPPPDLGGHDLGRDGARDGITNPDGQVDSIKKADGNADGLKLDLPPKEDAGPPLPDKGPKPDGCGQCTLSIYRINGSTTLPTQLSSLDDKDATKAGIQITVDVSADCTADGTDVELNVTGVATPFTTKVSGGYASFTGANAVTVLQTVGVVTLTPTGTSCTGTPRSFNVVRDPTCTFTDPLDGATLTSVNDAIPNNGTFDYTIKFATQHATGGTVTANIDGGASLGSALVSASTGVAQFANQVLPENVPIKMLASVEITLASGQKIAKPCLANSKTELNFTVDTSKPACTVAGFTPAAITLPAGGLGLGPLQDADGSAADLQTTVTVNTDPGVDVTLTAGGQTYGPTNSGTANSVTFDITVADGAPSFRATCVKTATGNQIQSGITKVLVDTAPPSAVTDLACFVDLTVSNHRKGILSCDWTSASDGATGSGVASYDVNCDKNAVLTVSGFDAAPIKKTGLLPTPTPTQTTEVNGLNIPNGYSCAVQAVDVLGNKSPVSNITSLVPFEFQVQEVQGTVPGGAFGTPIVAGDFNCDGLSDVAVGAPNANGNRGEVLVFFSNGATFSTTPQKITGTRTDGRLGIYLAALDYDGRTFNVGGVQRKCTDLAVAAHNGTKAAPRIYLFFGRPAFSARTDEGVGTGAEVYFSAAATDTFATAIASADLDGDGLTDLVTVHKATTDTNYHLLAHYGGATVPMMTPTGAPAQVTMPTSADIDLEGDASSGFGFKQANAGKIGTGPNESLIFSSAFQTNAAGGTGRAYLLVGQPRTAGKELLTLASSRIVLIDGDANSQRFGIAVAGVGDLNKDGINEFAVSDSLASNGTAIKAGAIYVFNLVGGTNSMTIADAKAVYSNDIADNDSDFFGRSIANVPAGAGSSDLNGDGIDDLVTTSSNTGTQALSTGYIFNGATGPLTPRTTTNANVSFQPPVGGTNLFGNDLVLLIDVNGDGFGDVLAGEYTYSSNLGRFVVYY